MYELTIKFDIMVKDQIRGYTDQAPETDPRLLFELNNNVCSVEKRQKQYLEIPEEDVSNIEDVELTFYLDKKEVPSNTCLLVSLIVDEYTGFHEYTGAVIGTTYIKLTDLMKEGTVIKKTIIDVCSKFTKKKSVYEKSTIKITNHEIKMYDIDDTEEVDIEMTDIDESTNYNFDNAEIFKELCEKKIKQHYQIFRHEVVAKKLYAYHVREYMNNYIEDEIPIPFAVALNTKVKYIPTIEEVKNLLLISLDIYNISQEYFIEQVRRQMNHDGDTIFPEFQKCMIAALHAINIMVVSLKYKYDLSNPEDTKKSKIRKPNSFRNFHYDEDEEDIPGFSIDEDQLQVPDFGEGSNGFDCEDGAFFCRLFIQTLILNRNVYKEDPLLDEWIEVLEKFEYVVTVNYCGDPEHEGYVEDIDFDTDRGVCHVLLLAIPKIQFFQNLINGIQYLQKIGDFVKTKKKNTKHKLMKNLGKHLKHYMNFKWLKHVYIHNLETTNFSTPTMMPIINYYHSDKEKSKERFVKIKLQDRKFEKIQKILTKNHQVVITNTWNRKLQNINIPNNDQPDDFFIYKEHDYEFNRLYGFYLYLLHGSLFAHSPWQVKGEPLLDIYFGHDLGKHFKYGALMQNIVLDRANSFIVPNVFYDEKEMEMFENLTKFSKPIIFHFDNDYRMRYENEEDIEAIQVAPLNDLLINNDNKLRKKLKKYIIPVKSIPKNKKKYILWLVHETFLDDYHISQFLMLFQRNQYIGFTYKIYTIGNNSFYCIIMYYT